MTSESTCLNLSDNSRHKSQSIRLLTSRSSWRKRQVLLQEFLIHECLRTHSFAALFLWQKIARRFCLLWVRCSLLSIFQGWRCSQKFARSFCLFRVRCSLALFSPSCEGQRIPQGLLISTDTFTLSKVTWDTQKHCSLKQILGPNWVCSKFDNFGFFLPATRVGKTIIEVNFQIDALVLPNSSNENIKNM